MKQETFKVQPHELSDKIQEITKDGWKIISTVNTSTPPTSSDAHGMSYGGEEISIIAEKKRIE